MLIERKTNKLLQGISNDSSQRPNKNEPEFRIISEWTLLKKTHENLSKSAQRSISITVPKFCSKDGI